MSHSLLFFSVRFSAKTFFILSIYPSMLLPFPAVYILSATILPFVILRALLSSHAALPCHDWSVLYSSCSLFISVLFVTREGVDRGARTSEPETRQRKEINTGTLSETIKLIHRRDKKRCQIFYVVFLLFFPFFLSFWNLNFFDFLFIFFSCK